MCIIVVKKAGIVAPTWKTLETCFSNNSDGAGFMYTDNGKVVINKGFMTFKDFKRAIKAVKRKVDYTATPFVYHFRIGTQGGNIPANTHPFPVSDNADDLRALEFTTNLGVAHNGIINLTSDYYSQKATLSDTQLFIKDYLVDLLKLNKTAYKSKIGKVLIERMIESKMAFLDGAGDISLIGDFVSDGGVFYSNESYKPRKIATSSYMWRDGLGIDTDLFSKYADYTSGYEEYSEEVELTTYTPAYLVTHDSAMYNDADLYGVDKNGIIYELYGGDAYPIYDTDITDIDGNYLVFDDTRKTTYNLV